MLGRVLFGSMIVTLWACGGTDGVTIYESDSQETVAAPTAPPEDQAPAAPSGGGSGTAEAPEIPEAPPAPKRVFVTARELKGGDLRTVDADPFVAADKVCTLEATAAKLGGTWKAMLSGRRQGQVVRAADRVAGAGPWFLVDGKTMVFADRGALTKPSPVKIDVLANGQKTKTGSGPWTGTRNDGSLGAACEDGQGSSWSSSSGNRRGTNGSLVDASKWLDDGSLKDCDNTAPIYCVEQ